MFTDSNILSPKTNRLRATIVDCGKTNMIMLLETNKIDAKQDYVQVWINVKDRITEELLPYKIMQATGIRNSLISDKLIVNTSWHTPKTFDFLVGQIIEFSFIKHISNIPELKNRVELTLYI